ncbi:MAG: NUDIX domain-containing protein [Phycisphaerae bacterium]|nr:NUDIX domain-containing protein [Phycisphaerae bacterium]MDW8262463.1 NUDIX domain-containing protein [Phycisphaerales bacterium]
MIAVYVARRNEATWEFLQLLRGPGRYLAGTWATVYGGVNSGETAWQAALRELFEETGIVPEALYRLPTARAFYTAGDDTLWLVPAFCALVLPDAAIRLNDEHVAYRWIASDQARDLFLWPTDRAAIVEIVHELLREDSPLRDYLRIDWREA